MIFLRTPRLTLRKLQEEDFEDFCEFAMDDDMCRLMGRSLMHTKEDARRNFNWLKDQEERCYGLLDEKMGRVIGNITVCNVSKDFMSIESLIGKNGRSLSFSISRHYQRKGLMFEAVSGLIKNLFECEGIDYIQCGHYPFNLASKALQEKLGFTYLTTQEYEKDGKIVTSVENILWR